MSVFFSRLSTIRSADKIVTLKDGKVAEIGTHGELMKARGLYFQLVTAQVPVVPLAIKHRSLADIGYVSLRELTLCKQPILSLILVGLVL